MSSSVIVKPTDIIQAGTLLKRLAKDADALKEKLKDDTLDDKFKYALAGALEVLLDLHNDLLENIKNVRMNEALEEDGRKDGGFDA